jgi:hypothetical protein
MTQNHSDRMRRLLASGLLPKRAGQPARALVHIGFADLCELDAGSALQQRWMADYRARWAAHRAAASVSPGDGGAWLDGERARQIACDAMVIPVVTGDVDPGAVEELIGLCVRYHALRAQDQSQDAVPVPDGAAVPAGLAGRAARQADLSATVAGALAEMEDQILAKILQVVSGPGGVASFPAPPAARQRPQRALPAAGRRADRRDPRPPAAAGRAARSDLPASRRLRPARGRLRTAPRGAPP